MRRLPAEHLLPLACIAGAALVIASEFMTIFELTHAGGTVERVSAEDQHHFALLILALFALAALGFALATGSRPAALAVAAAGAAILLLFLLVDLPDAGKVGTLDHPAFIQAEAEPTSGFWLLLAGALVLAICGGALATLGAEQLRALPQALAARRGVIGGSGGSDRAERGGAQPSSRSKPARARPKAPESPKS